MKKLFLILILGLLLIGCTSTNTNNQITNENSPVPTKVSVIPTASPTAAPTLSVSDLITRDLTKIIVQEDLRATYQVKSDFGVYRYPLILENKKCDPEKLEGLEEVSNKNANCIKQSSEGSIDLSGLTLYSFDSIDEAKKFYSKLFEQIKITEFMKKYELKETLGNEYVYANQEFSENSCLFRLIYRRNNVVVLLKASSDYDIALNQKFCYTDRMEELASLVDKRLQEEEKITSTPIATPTVVETKPVNTVVLNVDLEKLVRAVEEERWYESPESKNDFGVIPFKGAYLDSVKTRNCFMDLENSVKPDDKKALRSWYDYGCLNKEGGEPVTGIQFNDNVILSFSKSQSAKSFYDQIYAGIKANPRTKLYQLNNPLGEEYVFVEGVSGTCNFDLIFRRNNLVLHTGVYGRYCVDPASKESVKASAIEWGERADKKLVAN